MTKVEFIFGLVLSSTALVLVSVPGVAMPCLCEVAPAGTYIIGVKVFNERDTRSCARTRKSVRPLKDTLLACGRLALAEC